MRSNGLRRRQKRHRFHLLVVSLCRGEELLSLLCLAADQHKSAKLQVSSSAAESDLPGDEIAPAYYSKQAATARHELAPAILHDVFPPQSARCPCMTASIYLPPRTNRSLLPIWLYVNNHGLVVVGRSAVSYLLRGNKDHVANGKLWASTPPSDCKLCSESRV